MLKLFSVAVGSFGCVGLMVLEVFVEGGLCGSLDFLGCWRGGIALSLKRYFFFGWEGGFCCLCLGGPAGALPLGEGGDPPTQGAPPLGEEGAPWVGVSPSQGRGLPWGGSGGLPCVGGPLSGGSTPPRG